MKEWYERGSTPETEELADIRRGVRNQLAEQGVQTSQNPGGWKPFFDPEKRYYADPTSYPAPEDIQASMPKMQKTIDMYRAKVQTPENIVRARQDLELGRTLVDPKTGLPAGDLWYALEQLQKGLIDEMGPAAGHQRFMHITDGLAATTSGANPETNLVSTMYGLFLKNNDLPIPTGPNPAGDIANPVLRHADPHERRAALRQHGHVRSRDQQG